MQCLAEGYSHWRACVCVCVCVCAEFSALKAKQDKLDKQGITPENLAALKLSVEQAKTGQAAEVCLPSWCFLMPQGYSGY